MSMIRPIWLYGVVVLWNSAAKTHITKIQTIKNRILRIATNALWFVKNVTIHTDMKIPLVNDLLKKKYNTSQENAITHQPNHTGDCYRPTTTMTAQTSQEEKTLRLDIR